MPERPIKRIETREAITKQHEKRHNLSAKNRIYEQNTRTQKVALRNLYFNFDWPLQKRQVSALGELMVLLFSRAVSQLIICELKSRHLDTKWIHSKNPKEEP